MHKRKRATTVKVARAFISFCQLEYIPDSPDDKRYEKYQLSLVAILTTLCTTARNDFLIFDSKLQSIVLWKNGMELMRNCYCNRAIPVDRAQLLTLRDAFFARYRWFYDESRCISRNHQNPGNYDDQYRKANHLEESKKWQLIIGNVDYSAAAVTSTAAGTPALTEADISKKARKDKAFKDRQANSYNAIDTAKKLKIPKPSAVPTPPPPPVLISKIPQQNPNWPKDLKSYKDKTTPVQLIRQESAVSGSSLIIPTQKNYTFEDVQAVIREGDVMEQRIKQENRLRLVAAQENSRLEVEAAREKARIQIEEAKLEEQRIIGLQRLAKEQSILNAHNEGNRHCVIKIRLLTNWFMYSFVQLYFRSKKPELRRRFLVQTTITNSVETARRRNTLIT